jgi:SpoVK/Ycf46/Vps4 family AAA+-type ATPase
MPCDDKMNISEAVDLLVQRSRGWSGAETVACCLDAAMGAIEEGCDTLCLHHLLRCADKVKPQITEDVLEFYEIFQNNFH